MDSDIHNPHLEGKRFFLRGSTTGILLLHGLTATTAEVRPLGVFLNDKGCTVLAPLLPGHGTTPEDLNSKRWQDWVREAEEAYDELAGQCDQLFVAGESLGGLLALYLCAHRKSSPNLRGVLAFSPAIKLAIYWWEEIQLHLFSPFKVAVPKKRMDDDLAWQGYRVNPLRAVTRLLSFQREVKKCLPEIEVPVLLFQGGQDSVIADDCSEIIERGLTATRSSIIHSAQSRHVMLLDADFPLLTEKTYAFLQENLKRS